MKQLKRLGPGGFRSERLSHLLSAAFNDGPGIAAQRRILNGTVSHFNCGGLALRHEAQLKLGQLWLHRRIGALCGGDQVFQVAARAWR